MVHLRKSDSSSSSSSTVEKKKYPIAAQFYQLYEEVGQGASASVYRALCIPFNEIVAIKILDFEHGDPNNITHEAITMTLVDNPNVLKAHCSFACDQTIWVVMQYMDGGSCHHILKAAFPEGFHEVVIATVLREALKALDYLHQSGHIHRDIKNEYQRGISSWNFNVDDLKAEASLIHDVAEIIPENGQEGTSISLFGPDTEKIPSQCQPSTSHCLNDNNGNSDKGVVLPVRCPTFEHFNYKQRYDVPNMVGFRNMNLQAAAPTNLPVANGGDHDRKMDKHVFQQRGRFTVTSDDFDIEKAHPSPSLQ